MSIQGTYKKRAPIVIFVYNRPKHIQQTIESLKLNKYAADSDLIIYSDAPKRPEDIVNVELTRQYIKSITGFKSLRIVERDKNWGLAANIIDGVTHIVHEFGSVIVLEDDLITSPYFLQYMNDALSLYENEEKVISIHGYIYPIKRTLPETFFIKGADCWGWATWKRGWDLFNPDGDYLLKELEKRHLEKKFDFDHSYPYTRMLRHQIQKKNNSWAIRWYASAFLLDKLTLYPGKSLVAQIGMDGSGTHCQTNEMFDVTLSQSPVSMFDNKIVESEEGRKAFIHYFRYTMLYFKIKARLKRLFKQS